MSAYWYDTKVFIFFNEKSSRFLSPPSHMIDYSQTMLFKILCRFITSLQFRNYARPCISFKSLSIYDEKRLASINDVLIYNAHFNHKNFENFITILVSGSSNRPTVSKPTTFSFRSKWCWKKLLSTKFANFSILYDYSQCAWKMKKKKVCKILLKWVLRGVRFD